MTVKLTAEYKFPYPDPDESVDPARDIRALAEAIDTAASGWFPIGGIISHDETQVPPAGWLPCDGRAFTAAQYPVLAALLPGLKLPDLNGRSLVGASANPGYALNSVGGVATVAITANEMPNHAHGIGGLGADGGVPNHAHTVSAPGGVLSSGPVGHRHTAAPLGTHYADIAGSVNETFATAGGAQIYENRTAPPRKINRSGESRNHGHAGSGTYNLDAVAFPHTHTVNIGAHPGPGSFDRNNIPASTALAFAIRVE